MLSTLAYSEYDYYHLREDYVHLASRKIPSQRSHKMLHQKCNAVAQKSYIIGAYSIKYVQCYYNLRECSYGTKKQKAMLQLLLLFQ